MTIEPPITEIGLPEITAVARIDPPDVANWFAQLSHAQKAKFLNMAGKICARKISCDRIDGVYIAGDLDEDGKRLVQNIADGIGKRSSW